MPCRSDYQDPTPREEYCQRTAQLYKFVLEQLERPVPVYVQDTAEHQYASMDYTTALCHELTIMTPGERNSIVYNGHNATSRQLANWWEAHEKLDQKRKAQESDVAKQQALVASALDKLTDEEYQALTGRSKP